MPEITLYGTRQSPFVEKTVRGLGLKQLAFELVEPERMTDIAKWNPVTRKMPAADIDGERLYDSTFILRRLEELVPAPSFYAEDPATAANQRQLEDWADEALYWYAMGVLFSEKHADETASNILGDSVPGFLKPLLLPMVKRRIGGMTKAQGMGRLPLPVLLAEFGDRLDDLGRMLGERQFFYSDRASVADLAVYGQLARTESNPDLEAQVRQRPALVDYMKRVEQATGG